MLKYRIKLGNALRRQDVWLRLVVVGLLILPTLYSSDLPPQDYFERRLSDQVGGRTFDFVVWEFKAALIKLGAEFAAPQDTLSETQRHRLVTDYLAELERANTLEWKINGIYSQFSGQEARDQAAPQERALAEVRGWLAERQNLVEGILEEQTATELQAEGFGAWGYVWPPVKIRFTELPLLLVVSSRAEITREADLTLKSGLALTEQIALEDNIDNRFDTMRSLVTRIGGLSAYPAMILETGSLSWLADTFAHEWTHHFLAFHPLGYNYAQSGEMTSLNETTASIVGREIGRRVILRYYPEWADRLPSIPAPPDCPPMSAGALVWPDEPPAGVFDYNREMRKTRLRVDALLAEGQIDEAEHYMEERRHVFVQQGYDIRKLNQAFFSFHGSYATSPAAGNPIGGQLEWLRGNSPTLRAFVRQVSFLDNYDDFKAMLLRSRPGACQNE